MTTKVSEEMLITNVRSEIQVYEGLIADAIKSANKKDAISMYTEFNNWANLMGEIVGANRDSTVNKARLSLIKDAEKRLKKLMEGHKLLKE